MEGGCTMKTLVTGGTGFIGSHLVERLTERGEQVICVAKDRLNAVALEKIGATIVLGDLTNGVDWGKLFSGVDRIYHLAGVTRASSMRDYYDGNHLATQKFMEMCHTYCPPNTRLIYLSSLTAVGPSANGVPLEEDAPFRPVSHYGKSKMLGELEVRKESSYLSTTIIRPSAVYGPREMDMLQYMRLIHRGIHPIIGFKKKYLSLIHVRDLIDGILLAADSPLAKGKTYFLGSEHPYTNEDIGSAMAATLSADPMLVHVPHWIVYSIGALGGIVAKTFGKKVLFNIQKARECVQPAWVCSIRKAMAEIGFRQRISLEEGMATTYRWYKRHGLL